MKQNETAMTAQKPKFSVAINTAGYRKLINNTLQDPDRARRFIASITSAVAVNPALQECTANSIVAGALLGESLNLSPSPQLGQYYLVPFKNKLKDANGKTVWLLDEKGNHIKDDRGKWVPATETRAQFVLGYKGYIQLAIRSGQYKKLNVIEIKDGELISFDPLNEEIVCDLIEDYAEREKAPTIGYYAMFEYLNGFRKAMYWSVEKMMSHADQYSPAFSAESYRKIRAGEIADSEMWRYSSFWYNNFDDMAKKTMLRQLISRWGIMSTDLQKAYLDDSSMADFGESGSIITTPEEQMDPVTPTAPIQEPQAASESESEPDFQTDPDPLDELPPDDDYLDLSEV